MSRIRLEMAPRLIPEIKQEQRIELKQLIRMRQELHSPPPIEALRGLEGIRAAHDILTQKKLPGVLIGSLAVDLWNTSDPTLLARHKDVDVAVMSPNYEPVDIEDTEGGINWWVPKYGRIKVETDTTYLLWPKGQWWENVNGVVIGAGLTTDQNNVAKMPPGLLVPTPAWLAEMQYHEVVARSDHFLDIPDDDLEEFKKMIGKKTNPRRLQKHGVVPFSSFLPYFLEGDSDYVPKQEVLPLDVLVLRPETLKAIKSFSANQKK